MKYYRLLNKYTCKGMADKLKIKSNTIVGYESGKRHVPEKVIRMYCEVLKITPNDLYGLKQSNSKYKIPLYQATLKNKTPIGLNKEKLKTLSITAEEKRKGYSFAIQAWNMDNNPKIFTGDLLFFKLEKNDPISGDCILYLDNNIPYIKLYKEQNNNILLDTFSYKVSKSFYNKESFKKIQVLGRLVEVRSYLKKGGNPWVNGK